MCIDREKILQWAERKTKRELEAFAVVMIERSLEIEEIGFRDYPYCPNSGEAYVESDEEWAN